ncbi:putative rna-directed dna polymerase from transposon bs [Trichonephila clavata]|uniref:ribonuclease H n=1 Tax=Trichonephila clavata TaxID=2740835 RepID=A0A8X6FZ40_TRICU|nr:putative rna-directed dna polymerase from transposon bs [Trichonephila clavata]
MTVNTSKTVFQVLTLSTKPKMIQFFYGDFQLQRTEEVTYLGIVLDSRLSWKKQASRVQGVGKTRNGLLKRLTDVKWYTTQDLLCTTYKSYIRPAVEYNSEPLVTASEAVRNKIETVQNNTLRIITGGAFSTPILAMQLQVNIEPLTFRSKMGALKLIERLMRHGDFWRNYNPVERRLKSHSTFLHVTKELYTDFDIPSSNRQSLLETGEFIRHLSPACYNLYLALPVNKISCINTELRRAALATIGERFPESHWLHVYTDGSDAGANHKAGAGVYSSYFSLSRAVGANCTNYNGEAAVVHMALTEVGKREGRNIAIFIDSQAAILAVSSVLPSRNGFVLDCRRMINSLINNGRNIAFQWVPSHCGVKGNKLADA